MIFFIYRMTINIEMLRFTARVVIVSQDVILHAVVYATVIVVEVVVVEVVVVVVVVATQVFVI